ncbi:FecR family protein [Pontibacter anaerobius]|uniref:FecR domain-containing protein n=1 Tax=Pontibacter anaerobius TaxID=2993940 RepID=A0ABT3RFY4_9BACT|nr:FecR domain-containing protein [Pontibacter anaerobius]MCX2740308.1 FecR domain-containing protein [Pontibacter anaerobius]
MNYQLASAVDFAADELFAQWVMAPTAESDAYWQDWLEKNPLKQHEVEEARALVKLLSADMLANNEAEVDIIWGSLQQTIQQEELEKKAEANVVPIGLWQRKGLLRVAAAVTLLCASAFVLFMAKGESVKYATSFGEKRTVTLPDNSVVVLNANSSMTYTNNWPGLSPRRVYLKGEAYFDVAHKAPDQRFIVETADGTRVEVFGTEFNVKCRTNGSRVVLASGEVLLSFEQEGAEKQLKMVPGEMVVVSGKAGLTVREQVKTELYTAWKDNRVIFDNTSLREIANMLEQLYGYKVVIENKELAEQKLTANLHEKGVESILAAVSATLGAKITRHEKMNTILISNI